MVCPPTLEGACKQAELDADPEADEVDEDEATPTVRFLVRVAKYLLGGFESKNKMVRWRCVQLLAYVVESMAEMECVRRIKGYFSALTHGDAATTSSAI